MNLLQKLKETLFSVLPIMAIVLLLGLTVAPLGKVVIVRFLVGGLLLIVGLTIFTWGVDIGILPLGEKCGAALTSKKNILVLLGAAFVIGFMVTIAEPDVQVLADQINNLSALVNKWGLVLMIAVGVGLFVMLGLLRTVLNWNLRWVLIICYVGLFTLAFLSPKDFQGVSFDAGGATTGPMTVPFIMALGMGVSAVRSTNKSKDSDGSFGLTGIASIGPIAAVCVYGIILSLKSTVDSSAAVAEPIDVDALVDITKSIPLSEKACGLGIFVEQLPEVLKEVSMALLPLVGMFAFFQIFLLRMPGRQVHKISMGFFYSFIGLVIFLSGVSGGFMDAGKNLGQILGAKAFSGGIFWKIFLIGVGLIFGAVVVSAEPAVWVLTEQVESASAGNIRKKVLLISLSAGVAISIGLSMFRAIYKFSLWYILIPGYGLSLLLTFFCPPLFTGIAFDSGGVASGPMTSTFILSFTLGAAISCGGDAAKDAFGVIALVAMTPLIAIQILGIIFKYKSKINLRAAEKKSEVK